MVDICSGSLGSTSVSVVLSLLSLIINHLLFPKDSTNKCTRTISVLISLYQELNILSGDLEDVITINLVFNIRLPPLNSILIGLVPSKFIKLLKSNQLEANPS